MTGSITTITESPEPCGSLRYKHFAVSGGAGIWYINQSHIFSLIVRLAHELQVVTEGIPVQ